ncbi:MAG: hypothetical protein N2Z74_05170, partial [Syntrophales bacterium]|nr:hypothetical protein [Syntrophales bacterium]
TKNLTMSEEEKKEAHRKELEKKARALVVGYLEGRIDDDELREGLPSGGEDLAMTRRFLRAETLARIDPDGETDRAVALLKGVLGLDTAALEGAISSYRERRRKEASRRQNEMRERWEKKGISGSAVVVDPQADPTWNQWLAEAKDYLRQELELALPAVVE